MVSFVSFTVYSFVSFTYGFFISLYSVIFLFSKQQTLLLLLENPTSPPYIDSLSSLSFSILSSFSLLTPSLLSLFSGLLLHLQRATCSSLASYSLATEPLLSSPELCRSATVCWAHKGDRTSPLKTRASQC